ncbi:ribosome maturation factor RimP [Suicoccus acidiformans]|uniref:Ribosome maturation factor RimP n=1 Tax=Suicoccus acidiformans TaxID=2036206 RepID=A0A347WK64_9LACT|nr:ribosome maturation factor RimP [Suicoccus acidiformans]AXY25471.1 ribosome maturation factor RimP [Suicoccus acidiformans]
MSAIVKALQPIIEPIVQEHHCYLVDMEYVKEGPNWFLRVYADKEGGIDLDDCAAISEDVSVALDQLSEDPFPDAYYLEVSSPGAERPLKDEAAIEGAVGEYVHFAYYVPQHGESFHEGTLLRVEADAYILKVNLKGRIKELAIDKNAVSHARLAIKF